MAKIKSIFVCQSCGAQRPKWEGRCSECGAWNSLVEEKPVAAPTGPTRGWTKDVKDRGIAVSLSESPLKEIPSSPLRTSTGLKELDRVLGGGLVAGSYVLVGGDPGIGKSTLLLQMALGLAREGKKVLYISAEESVDQTRLRAERLAARHERIFVASESRMDLILNLAETEKPDALIVDSIQTVFMQELSSAPGTVSQVRECAAALMGFAKGPSRTSVFLVGHVTKEGSLAGPRVLEHMVDTVLSFEGDPHYHFRLLRALKNRFGATNELGVFQMATEGLREVANPSQFFLEERGSETIGSAVFAALEGSRPLLCEIQALSSASHLSMPRRTALGLDVGRVHLLMAVLDKYLDLDFAHAEVFVNVVGGLKLSEPAMDLAITAALLSTYWNIPLSASSCFFGEMGLTGEIRAVAFAEERLREAVKMGFQKFFLPASNKRHMPASLLKEIGGQCVWIQSVQDLKRHLSPPTKGKPRPAPLPAEPRA